jgi:hypothetical protein
MQINSDCQKRRFAIATLCFWHPVICGVGLKSMKDLNRFVEKIRKENGLLDEVPNFDPLKK